MGARGKTPPPNPVYARRVDPSVLAFSLSSHRYSYVGLLFNSRLIINKITSILVLNRDKYGNPRIEVTIDKYGNTRIIVPNKC